MPNESPNRILTNLGNLNPFVTHEMDYLCRYESANGSIPSWTSNTCQGDWINIIISLCATYIAVLLIAYLRWMESNRKSSTKNKKCMGHNIRCCLVILLFLIHWAEIAEAFLSIAPGHVFIVTSVSFILLIILVVLEHMIEINNHPVLFIVTGFLWLANGITRTLRFYILWNIHIHMDRLRSLTAVLSSSVYYIITVSDFTTAKVEMRMYQGEKPRDTLSETQSYRYDEVHFFSRATFYWMNRLLKSGYKLPIEIEDLGILPEIHSARRLHHKLEAIMLKYEENMTPVIAWKSFLMFMKVDFWIGGLFKLFGDLVGIVGPLGISVIVNFVASQKNSKTLENHEQSYASIFQLWTNGWTMAFIVFFASIAQSTFSQASTHFVIVKSIHLKVALQSLIYKKSLRLRTTGKFSQNVSRQSGMEKKLDEESIDLGVLVNLMSSDVTNIMSFFWIGHYIWAIPLKMFVIMFFLYMKLGLSAIVGAAGTILALMPLQLSIGKNMSRNTSAVSELTDERLQHLSVLIEKIRLFKLLGWENYYCNRILDIRRKELKLLDKDSVFWAISAFFTHVSSVFVSLITFGFHYLFSDIPLTSDTVFSSLALINQLMVPLFIFPVIVPKVAEALVSCKRISEFFRFPEVVVKREVIGSESNKAKKIPKSFKKTHFMTCINEEDEDSLAEKYDECDNMTNECSKRDSSNDDIDDVKWDTNSSDAGWILMIEEGVFSWSPESVQKKLVIEELKVPKGEIVAIIGKVGSGKSSLLSAILGEMPQISGRSLWSRNAYIAYCPQTPWLLNTTVRENILFGLPFRPRRYDQVIAACALKPDLDILPKKDLTEIGEKGIKLSGGQKQRIAIARVLYSRANLIILDDPLSSLDHSSAATIFDEGIKRLVRKCKRTVIFVTHNFQFLSNCNLVIVMEGGKIRAQGKPDDIRLADYELLKTWKESSLASNMYKENRAKERWELIKSIARVRRRSEVMESNGAWFTEDNMSEYLPLGKSRKLFEKRCGWDYISHDLPLPTDEFQSKIVGCGPSRRKNSMRKKDIGRARSLQDRRIKVSRVVRQYSSPLSSDTNKQYRAERNTKKEILSQFLSIQSMEQVKEDICKRSFDRVASSESGESDLFSDPVENVEIGENFNTKDTEDREYGKMKKKVYWSYARACGLKSAMAYFAVTLTWQIVRVNTDFWLGVWIESSAAHGMARYIYVYASLSVCAVILSVLSHGIGQFAGSQARKKLHDLILLNIVQCPNKLLESIPTGKLFNRFSADIEVIDKKLTTTIQRLMQFLLLCSSSIVINAIITPWFIIITVPMVLLYYIVQMFYRCSSRELQRIDSSTRSPIFSHFAETVSGLSTIRAFGCEDKFISSFYSKLNTNTNCFLMLNSTNRWLGIVLDYLGGIIVLLAMATGLIAVQFYSESVTPSLVGLAMNYTLLLPIYLNWVVKFFADCEIYLGAVERINATLQPEQNPPRPRKFDRLCFGIYKLDCQEMLRTSKTQTRYTLSAAANILSSDCLKLGDIKFENVTVTYGSSTEPALIKMNLHIPPGQKIGICGRSGSGKSTLALSLFNVLDIHEGVIKIDDIDITKIPLQFLRKSGSIIPQETLLFNGTVRENLDISLLSTDDELWSAIEEARLKNIIDTQYHGNLDSEINAGQSLSGGEKQLFSLARAILQKSSFLIMDEATSNLDNESEQILMSSTQKVFKGKTLLIIAHRLSTILDCDRIIVLDKGKIVEDGTPCYLINKSEGIFSVMVKSSEEGFLIP